MRRDDDGVDPQTERAARDLCSSLKLDPDAPLAGAPLWRRYIEDAQAALEAWRDPPRS